MGQCSTLPSEARNDSSTNNSSKGQESSRYRKDKDQMTESTSDNSTTPLRDRSRRPVGYNLQVQTNNDPTPQNPVQDHQPHGNYQYSTHQQQQQHQMQMQQHHHHQQQQPPPPMSSYSPAQSRQSTCTTPQPMQEEREGIPLPPENAVRQRCYKLNLESEHVGIHASESTARYDGQVYGPFSEDPPPLTYSASDDSNCSTNPTSVAIQTAQIFRGISVSKDGTILSQNARATRSNRGANKQKRGEKSRQAAKIDKAKDLVEEMILTGKAADDKDAQMVSLVIVGEYDEMKQLVRDGAKKLRDANGLPDEALFAVNRPRGISPIQNPLLLSPSRKRLSPFALGSPSSVPKSPSSKARTSTGTPKLKSHPRDPSRRGMEESRQNQRRGFSPMNDPCNDMFTQNGDSDWGSSLGLSRGFNSIWNCGGSPTSGTMSPTQNVHENKGYGNPEYASPQSRRPVMEGRNESNNRGMRGSERMEAPTPGHQHVVKA